jgi:hypothetical protein
MYYNVLAFVEAANSNFLEAERLATEYYDRSGGAVRDLFPLIEILARKSDQTGLRQLILEQTHRPTQELSRLSGHLKQLRQSKLIEEFALPV